MHTLTMTAMALANWGPTMPGRVAAEFVIPISTPAYLGAMSRWFMAKAASPKPPIPTPRVRKSTAVTVVVPR